MRNFLEGLNVEFAGHLDLCGPKLVEGWVFSAPDPARKIRLQVFVEGKLLGECVADRLRPDLRDAGMGDGHCAFSFTIPVQTTVEDFSTVRLRVANSVLYLLPDAHTSFPEMVHAAMPVNEPRVLASVRR